MSVLVIPVDRALGREVVRRLVAQGDQVRVVEPRAAEGSEWKELGAYVARGTPDDPDLIERAGQNVRSLILLAEGTIAGAAISPLVAGARAARIERVVVACGSLADDARSTLDDGAVEFVVLLVPSRRLRRARVTPSELAEAVDAADDLAGPQRVVLDLGAEKSWRLLGVERG